MTPRTRVLSFSHSADEHRPDCRRGALRAGEEAGRLSVVDGAQAVGGVAVDVKALGCDVYVTSAHKWLLAPPGCGLLT